MGEESSQAVNVPVATAWSRLGETEDSVLIDVRTRAEWAYVGVPDLSTISKQAILVEWQFFPDARPNGAFVEDLSEQLSRLGATKDSELFFICRSGARSLLAAQAMLNVGFKRCFNVAEGFEGPLDDKRHRGSRAGWKAQALPWVQG